MNAVNEAPHIPLSFDVGQNYPNPCNPTTIIEFDLPEQATKLLHIYDVPGQEMWTLMNGVKPAGFHKLIRDGRTSTQLQVSSGVCLCRMEATGLSGKKFSALRKMFLMK